MNGFQKIVSGLGVLNTVLLYTVLYVAYIYGWGFIMNTKNIDNLIIEVTRKCNLQCEHCLRGCAQDKDISYNTIYNLIVGSNIEYISSVTFTGGEPTLNINAINQFIDICKDNNVEVGNFYIVVNGVNIPDDFIIAVVNLYTFCTDNEISAVQVSKSDFYTNQDCEQIKKLELLSIFSYKNVANNDNLIYEGRAINWIDDNGIEILRDIDIDYYNDELLTDRDTEDFYNVHGDIYLNVHGDILSCCDLSYESQDKYKLGNVNDNSLTEIINKLYKRE